MHKYIHINFHSGTYHIYIYIHTSIQPFFEDYVRGYAPQIWLNMVWHIYYPLFVDPESPIQEG